MNIDRNQCKLKEYRTCLIKYNSGEEENCHRPRQYPSAFCYKNSNEMVLLDEIKAEVAKIFKEAQCKLECKLRKKKTNSAFKIADWKWSSERLALVVRG